MDIYMKLLSIIHFIMICFTACYLLLFQSKHWFDIYYILYFILVNIHWFFLNGECLISYIYTKYFNKQYKPGDSPSANNDITNLFEGFLSNNMTHVLIIILLGLYLFNIYFVLRRNAFNNIMILLMIGSYIFYILSMRFNVKLAHNYSLIHMIIYLCALLHYSYILCCK